MLIYFDCAKVTILVSSQVWYKNTNDPTKKNMWNNCRATSFRLKSHDQNNRKLRFRGNLYLTAIARPQAPLSHPARARGRVFTAGLIPITLYRFVFADFLLLSKSCHHVSAPSLHSVLKGQSHCWALNWARKTATCELSKRNMSWPWGPGY